MRDEYDFSNGTRGKFYREGAVERWLREQVVPACHALKADPSRAITPQRVRARLAAERQKARDKK